MAMTKCPKCGGSDIDMGDMLSAGAVIYKSDTHKYAFHENRKSYVCMDCGFTESYVSQEYIDKIRVSREKE